MGKSLLNLKYHFAFFLLMFFFVMAVMHFFDKRFSKGDMYPSFSSLSTQKDGTKGFFEALDKLENIEVSRNFEPYHLIPKPHETTIIFSGLTHTDPFSYYTKDVIEPFFKNQNRIILLYSPKYFYTFLDSLVTPDSTETTDKFFSLKDHLGFQVLEDSLKIDNTISFKKKTSSILPDSLYWKEGLKLELMNDRWEKIYDYGARTVVAEMQTDSFSVVISTDSYLVSNTALKNNREPAFLKWLIGKNSHVVFDEVHAGLYKQKGVSYLIGSYHLQFPIFVLLLLSICFIWQNMASFLPKMKISKQESYLNEYGIQDGFQNLLSRLLPKEKLIPICLKLWEKSSNLGSQQIEIVEDKQKISKTEEIIQQYKIISRQVNRRYHG